MVGQMVRFAKIRFIFSIDKLCNIFYRLRFQGFKPAPACERVRRMLYTEKQKTSRHMTENNPQPGGITLPGQAPSKFQFTTPTDIIELPSKGIFYPGGEPTVLIEYLTAKDENILSSPNLLKTGKFLDVMLDRKVKSPWVVPSKLLVGDRNAIINALRVTAYGAEYPLHGVIDPETDEPFDTVIDLTALSVKPLGAVPDEKLEFGFTLEKSGKRVKFRFLTAGEEEQVMAQATAQAKMNGGIMESVTMRLKSQIMEIDGDRNKLFISEFIDRAMPLDLHKLRRYIADIEPDLLLETEVSGPSGVPFRHRFSFDILEYLFPYRSSEP